MRTPAGRIRNVMCLMVILMLSIGLAACGGGGGGTSSTSPGVSGPATVRVSIASAPSYPAGTTFATTTSSPAVAAPPANSPAFDNVFVTVTKLALIPSTGPEFPDPNGELENSSSEGGKGFVTDSFNPVTFDLLHPNSSSGDNVATLLNQFKGVPAGEYSKIRVYYDNVIGQPGDKLFHPTAHYHFDVHFVGGNLVIPESTDPEGGIRFYSIEIKVVGLKYHEAGQSGNILLRPQVFAEVVGVPTYIVTGEADQVNHGEKTFLVKAVHDNISVTYGSGTKWFYFDDRFVGPFQNPGADYALRNTAHVDVIGTFLGGVLSATDVHITFPDTRTGSADNVWIFDNTAFIVRSEADNDNVTVFPMPDRDGAYYDNSTSPLSFTAIDNGTLVKVRGYFNTYPNLDAYWISIGL